MRYEYIEPFVTSTIKILNTVIQSDISREDLSLVEGGKIGGDISIIIKVDGNSEGSIITNMDIETALNICNVMTGGNFKYLTPFVLDSISELSNMIAGNAISSLNDLGFDFKVSIPLIVKKEDIKQKIDGVEVFQVPLFTDCGKITINFVMKTN